MTESNGIEPKIREEVDLNRRDFFHQLLWGSLGLSIWPYLQSCSNGEKNTFQKATGLPPFKVWEEILSVLENSAAHLQGKMTQLIEEGNPEKMFLFVRDEFQLLPTNQKNTGDINATKWGLRYALRSGFATPREKAELLKMMFSNSGIPAEIIAERTDFSKKEVRSFYLRPIKRVNSTGIPEQTLKRWASELGYANPPKPPINLFEDIPRESDKLGDFLLKELNVPNDYRYYHDFDYRWDNYNSPAVSFEFNGEKQFAHLFDPSVPFGRLKNGGTSRIKKANPLQENEDKVDIQITYRDAISPREEKILLKGSWLASELVGRQLNIAFLNDLSLREMSYTPAANVATFTPSIALQAIDESEEYMGSRSFVGNPFTLSGERIILDENDDIQVDGVLIKESDNKDAIKKVRQITAIAKSTGYPNVKIGITPTDEDGKTVPGLPPSAFQFIDNGQPVRARMKSNQLTPRVLLMVDASGSMPDEYSGESMILFVNDLKKEILKKAPAAKITLWETTSSLFTWLLKASKTANDLIIYATDGHVWDTYNKEDEVIYKNGAPAIILDVNNTREDTQLNTFNQLASITDGAHFPAEKKEDTITYIVNYLNRLELDPYTFTYQSVGLTNERSVQVFFDNKSLSAEANYTIPEQNNPDFLSDEIIGIYLIIDCDGSDPVKRVLAGWDNELQKNEDPSSKMAKEVNDLMFSSIQLYFEGNGPTDTNLLCDILKSNLSHQGWGEALLRDNIEEAQSSFFKGFHNIAPDAISLMKPLEDSTTENFMTYSSGLRIGVKTFIPGHISGKVISKFDYFPTAKFITLCENPKRAFEKNLKQTAQFALREKRLFEISTAGELENKNLINLESAKANDWFDTLSRENGDYFYWRKQVGYGSRFKIFDKNNTTRVFWNIHENTGQLDAILPDNSGGGRFQREIDGLGKTMDLLMSIIEVMDMVAQITRGSGMLRTAGATSLGIIAKYGVTLTKLYAIASEAILIMDTTGMDEKIKKVLQEFACEVQKAILYATNGNAGATVSGLDNLIGMIMGDESPFSCSQ